MTTLQISSPILLPLSVRNTIHVCNKSILGSVKENWKIVLHIAPLPSDEYGSCDVLTYSQRAEQVVNVYIDDMMLAEDLEHSFARTLAHELEHARQVITGELIAHDTENAFYWNREKINLDNVDYKSRPWEHEALKAEEYALKLHAKYSQKELASA